MSVPENKQQEIHYKETAYGFEYGAAKVERFGDNIHTPGDVVITIITPKTPSYGMQIRVTKTGKITMYPVE